MKLQNYRECLSLYINCWETGNGCTLNCCFLWQRNYQWGSTGECAIELKSKWPRKGAENVMINFVNDTKAYKAVKKESFLGRIAGGPYETLTRLKWQMKFSVSVKLCVEKIQS